MVEQEACTVYLLSASDTAGDDETQATMKRGPQLRAAM